MAVIKHTDGPKITDDIQVDFITYDDDDNPINPYRVDSVVVYFIERDFAQSFYKSFTETVDNLPLTMYYSNAVPTKALGNAELPAWLSTDTSEALIEKVSFDDDGNVLVGNFRFLWKPTMIREGDYVLCWTYTQLPAAEKSSRYESFYVYGDTEATTALPSHQTMSGKYETLLTRYLPEMFSIRLSEFDLTPDVLSRMNQALAKGFTSVEDLANQLIDLLDANVVHEANLPYLANYFRLKLRSQDPTLWRRQIKRAVPLYKKKGTLDGLSEALGSAGITFNGVTRYWQITSTSTYQESFIVEEADQADFILAKNPILPIDPQNFELYLRYVGTEDYVSLNTDYVSFSTDEDTGISTMTWIPDGVTDSIINLEIGDVVRILYKIRAVSNQTNENYIRSLPYADTRDETLFSFPKKNWNVRLIDESDAMFDVLIPKRHPFAFPVVFGKIRTEFAYSENVYNMEEYNGSLRDSNNPCDIDRNFLDSCSACASSVISVDVEIENLTNDRITEAREIIKDYIPFHAQLYTINYSAAVNEFILPVIEDVEILNQVSFDETILVGQGDFNRVIEDLFDDTDELKRNALANSSTAVSSTGGTGFNEEIVIYSPIVRFDQIGLDTDTTIGGNFLEILSGSNAGEYQLEDSGKNVAKIVSASPDTIPFPLNRSAFTYRLSNKIVSDNAASITQDDLFVFSDTAGYALRNLNVPTSVESAFPAKLVITTGIYAGTYTIYDSFPDNTFVILGFGATSNVTGLRYKVTSNDGSVVYLDKSSSSVGKVAVTRRALVTTVNLTEDWDVTQGYYVRYNGADYKISGFTDVNKAYILGYTAGSVGGVTVTVYKRLVTDDVGYVDIKGMYLVTAIDYEAGLDVQDGTNPPVTPVESGSFMGNFLVQIGSNYYQIVAWDGTRIDLLGPPLDWGLTGTAVNYTILQYDPVLNVDVNGIVYQRLDRRGLDNVDTTTEGMAMAMRMSALNTGGQIVDSIYTDELVSFNIEWANGNYTEGQI